MLLLALLLAPAQDVAVVPGTPEIPPFSIQRAEVIWKDFDRYRKGEKVEGVTRPMAPDFLPPELEILPKEADAPDAPASYLRWHGAVEYAAWLSRTSGEVWRLPSEGEWRHARAAGAGLRNMDDGQWEYVLESDRPEIYDPVVLKGNERQRIPETWFEYDSQRPRNLWYLIGPAPAGFRLVRVEEAEGREARTAAASEVVVRVLRAREPRARSWLTPLEVEVENRGGRALAELEVLLYALTPKGRPHLADVAGDSILGRPTFTRAWPVLAGSRVEARRPPLKPGESRRFQVEVPTSFDDEKDVDPKGWGGRAVTVRFPR